MLPFHDKNKLIKKPEILVAGRVPTYFWKKDGNTIVEMTRPEKIQRLEELEVSGKQDISISEIYPWMKKTAIWSCLGGLILLILGLYLSKHVRLT